MRPLTNNLNQRGVWWLQLGMSLPSHGSPILSSTSLRVAVLQVLLQPHLSRLGIPLPILLRRQYSVFLFMQLQQRSLRKRKVGCLSELHIFYSQNYPFAPLWFHDRKGGRYLLIVFVF